MKTFREWRQFHLTQTMLWMLWRLWPRDWRGNTQIQVFIELVQLVFFKEMFLRTQSAKDGSQISYREWVQGNVDQLSTTIEYNPLRKCSRKPYHAWRWQRNISGLIQWNTRTFLNYTVNVNVHYSMTDIDKFSCYCFNAYCTDYIPIADVYD